MNLLDPKVPLHNLAEIDQQIPIKFSFAHLEDEGIRRIHEWVKCRDFLGDLMVYTHTQKPGEIYGFQCAKGREIDLDATRFVVKCDNDQLRDGIVHNVEKILHPIEEANGFTLTQVTPTLKDPNILYISGDAKWQTAVWSVSLYTFLIKVCGYVKTPEAWMDFLLEDESYTNEQNYVKQTREHLPTLLSHLDKLMEIQHQHGWKTYVGIHQLHNTSGFVSICMLAKSADRAKENHYATALRKLMVCYLERKGWL